MQVTPITLMNNRQTDSLNLVERKTSYQQLFEYGIRHKTPFMMAIMSAFIFAFLKFLIPQVSRYAIDVLIPQKQFQLLPLLAVGILCFYVFFGVFNSLRVYLINFFAQKVINSIRTDLYNHIQNLSTGFFVHNRTGNLMSYLVRDVDAVGNLFSSHMAELVIDIASILVLIVYMLTMDWQLAILVIVTWPLIVYIMRLSKNKLEVAYRELETQAAEVSNILQDTISTIQAIKSFGNEKYEIDRFAECSHNYMDSNLRAIRRWSLVSPILNILNNLSSILVLVFGSWEVMLGRLTIGELTTFLMYVNIITKPFERFNGLIDIIQKAMVGAERIFEVLALEPEIKEKEDAINLKLVRGRLKFEGIEFGYEANQTIIHSLNLDIQPGMKVALVGSSGAGKSTIAKLAARFYDPQKGRVLIDDYDLRDISLKSLREHIGIVSQENLLLYGTVRDNIAYGKLDASDEEIEAAAKAAYAHDFIMELPNGYNSIIGERGVKLSGGQKQRIAIARVLLKNPEFVILDEATSALDTESERMIQQSVATMLEKRTSLIIAHRLSTIQNADLIVVLEKGKVVETGTHNDLILAGGRYASFTTVEC